MQARLGSTKEISTLGIRNGENQIHFDQVATEEPMEIRVLTWEEAEYVPHRVSVTMRTPGDDFELAAGFLFTEGVITEPKMIDRIDYCVGPVNRANRLQSQRYNIVSVFLSRETSFDVKCLSRHVYTTSSCGICGKTSLESVRTICRQLPIGGINLSHDYFLALPENLRNSQRIFSRTGGLHAAALFDPSGKLLLIREDVGRHNALDKLVGTLLLESKLPASDTVLLVSGRASFELVQKAGMGGIPILAAIGAPSSLAIQLAQELEMTLIGFLRENRFNVYSCPERIGL